VLYWQLAVVLLTPEMEMVGVVPTVTQETELKEQPAVVVPATV
jgi:hypothetical protein